MRVISKSNASSLDFQGATYEPGPDGVFEFPEPVAVELTTKHASMWVAEAVHLAAVTAAQMDNLRNPNFLVTTVADLIGRVAALEANSAAASKPKAPKAAAPETPPADTGEKAPAAASTKQTAAQKRAAAKKAAASKSKPDTASDQSAEGVAPTMEVPGLGPVPVVAETPAEPDPGTGGE
jgi:hypothetical protein